MSNTLKSQNLQSNWKGKESPNNSTNILLQIELNAEKGKKSYSYYLAGKPDVLQGHTLTQKTVLKKYGCMK